MSVVSLPHSSMYLIRKERSSIREFRKIELCFFVRPSGDNGSGKGPTPHAALVAEFLASLNSSIKGSGKPLSTKMYTIRIWIYSLAFP